MFDGCACVVMMRKVGSLEIGWWAGSDEISWLVGFGGREVKRVFLNFFWRGKASLSLVEVNFWQDNNSVCCGFVGENMAVGA